MESIINAGLPYRLSGGLNSSLNKDKFSFFSNVSIGHSTYNSISSTVRNDYNNSLSNYKNDHFFDGRGKRANVNVGLSYEPDTTLSLGLEVNYDLWDFIEDSDQTSIFNYKDVLAETVKLSNQVGELENELWINFSMEKNFKSNQILKFSLSTGGEDEVNYYKSDDLDLGTSPDALNQFLLRSDETEGQRYYQGQLDLETPFFKFGKLEAGVKADFIDYDILQKVNFRSDSLILPDNDFSMDMQKLGLYIMQTHKYKKLEYAIGLRAEQFDSEAIQRANNEIFIQEYFRLFPSLQLHYLLPDQSHSIGFNFTRRIQRPGFFDLNPFVSYQDPLNLETGNPALRPEIGKLYELTYHRSLDKFIIDLTLYRRETEDAIQSIVEPLDNDQSLETQINFGQQINQGMESQLEYRPHKTIKTTATFVLSQVQFSGTESIISFNKKTTWSARVNQQFNLPNNFKIVLTGYYRAPRYGVQSKTLEQYYINLNAEKKFNNKRGSISLGIRDIFNTREYAYLLKTDAFELERKHKWQTRSLTLGTSIFYF